VQVLGESLRRWAASSTRATPAPPRTRRRPDRTLTVPLRRLVVRLSRHDGEGEGMLTPRMRNRRFAVPLPRTGYFQIAYLAPKGANLRTEGIDAFRAT
jgi:hypothetical protein